MIFTSYYLSMKKKATRHYAHIARSLHHHRCKHLPNTFYYKGSLLPIIFWKTIFLLAILCIVWYFLIYTLPSQLTPSDHRNMIFSFEGSPEDWGIDSSSLNTHGAAPSEFDFLFTEPSEDDVVNETTESIDDVEANISTEESTTEPISSQEVTATTDTSEVITSDPQIDIPPFSSTDIAENTSIIIYQDLALHIDLISTLFESSFSTSPQEIGWWSSHSGTDISVDIESNSIPLPVEGTAPCKTPWWEIVQHKDLILAYQQRTDVNSLCNVQKRYCFNGKLTGSYSQKSCKEDLKYTYQEVLPVAENNPNIVDPFIQPDHPRLSGAKFDVHGKINTISKATDDWSDSHTVQTNSTWSYVEYISSTWTVCVTPWWETLTNWKFVKAYKTSIGLIDMPCEVEIRLCTNSVLKWSFTKKTCLYKNMTYSDYLLDKWEDTNEPNSIDMMDSVMTQSQKNANMNPSFWEQLSRYF